MTAAAAWQPAVTEERRGISNVNLDVARSVSKSVRGRLVPRSPQLQRIFLVIGTSTSSNTGSTSQGTN
jgi:hypothetical protein